MAPGEKAFGPFAAEKLLVDEKPKNIAGEDLLEPGVVDPGDLMESPGLIHSALGQ